MRGKFASGAVHTLSLPEMFGLLHEVKQHPDFAAICYETDEWNGHLDFDTALRFAEFGWSDAPTIERITVPNVHSLIEEETFYYDVCGEVLDMPAHLSGSPECWMSYESELKPKSVIKLAVELGGAGTVPAYQLKNRGEAIIALINSLELAGHSIELNIVRAFTEKRTDKTWQFLIRVKDAGQVLDIQRLQFMIGHPAFYRRCLFGLGEIAKGSSMMDRNTYTASYKPAGYVHIPSDAGLYSDPQTSLAWASAFADGLSAPALV